ncbi:MAG: nicotinate (nicotinamide) nucleotide adenylyltransferase [Clostridia bacterium]|nr:nicotinate (nicotinamide) nucleotide adenylyltransferase [Clostridia bacterium]
MNKIVIFGGSFDPITKEHINVIKALALIPDVEKVIVVPTYKPPHKKASGTFYKHKVEMLNLALKDMQKVEISLFEIELKRVVYSWETIKHFKEIYPSFQICFAMGTDMLDIFSSWKNPEYIAQNATIILFNRDDKEKTKRAILNFENTYNKKVLVQEYNSTSISSTEIRVKNMLNLPIDDLADSKVVEYIKQKNLYLGDRFYYYINQVLPEKRRRHTAGVIIAGLGLAKRLKLDSRQVEIACLLHDNAKYLNYKDYKGFAYQEMPKNVVHQFLGEYIAREQLGVIDEQILVAIKYHTTGRKDMSLLEKVVFMADIIESGRTFNGVERLRALTEQDFNLGFKESVKDLLESLSEDKYYLTIQAYNYYVKGEL